MIPLQYRLRHSVRLEPGPCGAWRVISTAPLNVVDVNAAAARLLQRARIWATVDRPVHRLPRVRGAHIRPL